MVLGISVFAILACPIHAFAQDGSGSNPLQDPNAVSAVNTALISMGGATAYSSIQDATVTGQTNAPDSLPTGQITWQTIGVSIRSATTSQSATTVYAVQSGSGSVEDASGSVAPMDARQALTIFPYHLPGVVLLYLLNASDRSLSVIQDTGTTPNIVHVRSLKQMSDPTLTPVTQQDWYIDMSTGLPSRVDYYLPNVADPTQDGTATILFTSWQKTPTVLMPQTLQIQNNGSPLNSVTLSAGQFNQGLSATIFQLP
jgi:hypothetical protein